MEDGVRPRKPKRADAVVAALKERIAAGELAPGSKLPTEVELGRAFGVSRTVVREAIAALSGDGLVQPRQGAGVFVLDRPRDSFASLISDLPGRLSAVLNVLEVRIAVEVEAAGLAAERRSAAQEAEIRQAFAAFSAALDAGRPTGEADLAFHRAIAEATNNPFFVEIFDVLGRRTIPRDLVAMAAPEFVRSRPYLETMQAEHGAILRAIAARDRRSAEDAMRCHLQESQQRYQQLLETSIRDRQPAGGDADAAAPAAAE